MLIVLSGHLLSFPQSACCPVNVLIVLSYQGLMTHREGRKVSSFSRSAEEGAVRVVGK